MFDCIGKIYVIQEEFKNGPGYPPKFPLLMMVTRIYYSKEFEGMVREGLDNIGFVSTSKIYNTFEPPYRLATEQEIILFWPENEKKGPA